MGAHRQTAAAGEIARLCREGLDWVPLVEGAGAALRRAVPHERFCFHRVDPATMLLTSGVSRNLDSPSGYRDVIRNEYEEDDVNKWSALARSPRPAARLTDATGGRPGRSARFRDLLRPQGCAWEIRASLVVDDLCWGALGIYRSVGERDFSDGEVAFVRAVAASLAEGFRRTLIVASIGLRDGTGDDPGVVVLDDRGDPCRMDDAAARWMDELRGDGGIPDRWLPAEVHGVAARARRLDGPPGDAHARVRTRSGRWLSLHGTRLGGSGEVAVVIHPARELEVAPLVAAALGLTPRERVIAAMVLRGLSTADIAQEARISPYTVQDHLKAIFEKAGVRSRRELVAQIFERHHWPALLAGRVPDLDGRLPAATPAGSD